jgi:hypothetical protein
VIAGVLFVDALANIYIAEIGISQSNRIGIAMAVCILQTHAEFLCQLPVYGATYWRGKFAMIEKVLSHIWGSYGCAYGIGAIVDSLLLIFCERRKAAQEQ